VTKSVVPKFSPQKLILAFQDSFIIFLTKQKTKHHFYSATFTNLSGRHVRYSCVAVLLCCFHKIMPKQVLTLVIFLLKWSKASGTSLLYPVQYLMGCVNEAMTSSLMVTLLLTSTCHYPPVANGIAPISANMTNWQCKINVYSSK